MVKGETLFDLFEAARRSPDPPDAISAMLSAASSTLITCSRGCGIWGSGLRDGGKGLGLGCETEVGKGAGKEAKKSAPCSLPLLAP